MIIQSARAVIEGELLRDCWVSVEGGIVTEIGKSPHPLPDVLISGTLIPSFIDIHCHGGGGSYFSEKNRENAIKFHRAHGTGTVVASLVSEPLEILQKQIQELIPLFKSGAIAGIHLEGPYLSKNRCGAHRAENLINPRWEDLSRLIDTGEGAIVMVTIAPELDGAIECIRELSNRGVIAAIGHTAAPQATYLSAVDAGASVITHFSNAMVKPDQDRELVRALLDDSRLSIELILDGEHVSAKDVREIIAIDPARLILVTDAMSAAGEEDGQYAIGDLPVIVSDGIARLENGALAGSTLTLDRAFARLVSDFGVNVADAVRATSTNAATLLGKTNLGVIKKGARADFLVWDGEQVLRNEKLSL